VPFRGYFVSEDKHTISIQLKKLNPLSFNSGFNCIKRTRELITIVDSMLRAGVMHRDIKLENLMIDPDSDSLNIIDFGLARLDPSKTMVFNNDIYTLGYRPIELMLGARYFDTEKAEVWSVGMCVLNMMMGRFNVAGAVSDFNSLVYLIDVLRIPIEVVQRLHPSSSFYLWWAQTYGPPGSYREVTRPDGLAIVEREYGSLAKEFLLRALDPDPATRATLRELIDHPFFQSLFPAGTKYEPKGNAPRSLHMHVQTRSDLVYICGGVTSRLAMLKAELICLATTADSSDCLVVPYPRMVAISALAAMIEDDFMALSHCAVNHLYRALPPCNELMTVIQKPDIFTILSSKYQ
jgi:serine/threonine protein kinase